MDPSSPHAVPPAAPEFSSAANHRVSSQADESGRPAAAEDALSAASAFLSAASAAPAASAIPSAPPAAPAASAIPFAAPAAPAANKVRIYAVDNGSGKTQLMALFATGAAQQIAIEP
jgi:hypothetical protein